MKKLTFIVITFITLQSFSQNYIASNISPSEFSGSRLSRNNVTTLDKIFFNFNDYTLSIEAIKTTKKVIDVMNENPEIKISINSFSNVNETPENLSLKRGLEIKKLLIKKGISANRLVIKNFGSTKPVSESEPKSIDQRVEFALEK